MSRNKAQNGDKRHQLNSEVASWNFLQLYAKLQNKPQSVLCLKSLSIYLNSELWGFCVISYFDAMQEQIDVSVRMNGKQSVGQTSIPVKLF